MVFCCDSLTQIHRMLQEEGCSSECASLATGTLVATSVAVTCANFALSMFAADKVHGAIDQSCLHRYPNATQIVDLKWCKGWAPLAALGVGVSGYLVGAIAITCVGIAVCPGIACCVNRFRQRTQKIQPKQYNTFTV